MKVKISDFSLSGNRKINVKIHDYDAFNMDTTIALIVRPLLEKFKESSNYTPSVLLKKIPNPNPTEEEITEANKKWQKIIDKMIFSFSCIESGHPIEDEIFNDYFSIDKVKYQKEIDKYNKKISKGLKLFAKYYRDLWN